MTNLDESVASLGRAVEKLTRALGNGAAKSGSGSAIGLAESLRTVQQERDGLHADLESLRAEHR